MKKLAVILLSVMIATTFLTSCGKDKAKDVKDEVKKEIKYDFTDKSKTVSLNFAKGFSKDSNDIFDNSTEVKLSKKSENGSEYANVSVFVKYEEVQSYSLKMEGDTLKSYIYAEDLSQKTIKKYGQKTIKIEYKDGKSDNGRMIRDYVFVKKDKENKGYGYIVIVHEDFLDGDDRNCENQANKIKFDFDKSKLKKKDGDKDDK